MVYLIQNKQTKTLMGVSTFSNVDDEYCNSVGARFELAGGDPTLYCVNDLSMAQAALRENPRWFNSSTSWPEWPDNFDPSQWEIVSVDL